MNIIAGRIINVKELQPYFSSTRWNVVYKTCEGLDSIILTSHDSNILAPLENESIQIIPYFDEFDEFNIRRFFLIFISGRQFSIWRSPEEQ